MPVADFHAADLFGFITEQAHTYDIPSAALAVVDGSGPLLERGIGMTSAEDSASAVTANTLFRIASTSKLLVVTMIMRLVESGELSLNTPLAMYIPWLQFSQAKMEQHVTLRHLLSHTSGLATYRGDAPFLDEDGLERFVRERLPTYPFLTPPDTCWLYTNAGISLAAFVAQTVTGVRFRRLMQEVVFTPLTMERTTFDPLVAMTYPFAQAHQRDQVGAWRVEHTLIHSTAWEPAGGAFSTAHDLANLARMYLNEGVFDHHQFLKPGTIQLMQTPQVRLWTVHDEGYGLTFLSESYPITTLVRHNGGGLASYASAFYLAPQEGVGLILLASGGLAGKLIKELLPRVFAISEELDSPKGATTSSSTLEDQTHWQSWAGTYLGPYTGLVTIQIKGDALLLERNGRAFVLTPLGERRYRGMAVEGTESIFIGFPKATPEYVVVDDSPCRRITNHPSDTLDPSRWIRFAGVYVFSEATLLPTTRLELTVSIQEEHLFVTWSGETIPCIALDADRFACDWGVIAFREEADGTTLEFQQTLLAHRRQPQ